MYNDAYLDDLIGPADDDEKPAARATAGAAREFRFTPDPEEVADEEYNPYQDMVVAAGDHSDDEYGGGGRRNRRYVFLFINRLRAYTNYIKKETLPR